MDPVFLAAWVGMVHICQVKSLTLLESAHEYLQTYMDTSRQSTFCSTLSD